MAHSGRQKGLGQHLAIQVEEGGHLKIRAVVGRCGHSGYICGALIGLNQYRCKHTAVQLIQALYVHHMCVKVGSVQLCTPK